MADTPGGQSLFHNIATNDLSRSLTLRRYNFQPRRLSTHSGRFSFQSSRFSVQSGGFSDEDQTPVRQPSYQQPAYPQPTFQRRYQESLESFSRIGYAVGPVGRRHRSSKKRSRRVQPEPEPDSDTSVDRDRDVEKRGRRSEKGKQVDEVEISSSSSRDRDIEKQASQTDKEKKDEQTEEEEDPNIVDWDGDDDPENPVNFSYRRKWAITIALASNTFTVTFASSVFSTATMSTAKEFKVSPVVMVLGTSLFVLGFAFGPICFGPLSELYGRKYPLFFGMFVFAIFNIPVAVAQNLQTIFICRFFGGFFASAPLAIVGGALADIFDPVNRGVAIAIFAATTFIGPTAGPIMGGFITMSYLGWRWTQWITLIMAVLFATTGMFIVPETYAPVLLQRKAQRLRFETKNWALRAKPDEQRVEVSDIMNRYLLRPFKMLALEPILVLITLYMGFIYGFLYLTFEAYPIAFQMERKWNLGVGALPFVAIVVGVVLAVIGLSIFTKTRFKRRLEETGHVVPEERLIPMMVGGFLLPAGMFWFGWTSNPHIIWIPQAISGAFLGAGVLLIFMQGLNYIIDVYTINANSAIAANTFFRSWLGAGFPMFATGMFTNLGVPWAMSLLGFLTAALAPVPILFYFYGPKIRKMSRYIPQ